MKNIRIKLKEEKQRYQINQLLLNQSLYDEIRRSSNNQSFTTQQNKDGTRGEAEPIEFYTGCIGAIIEFIKEKIWKQIIGI